MIMFTRLYYIIVFYFDSDYQSILLIFKINVVQLHGTCQNILSLHHFIDIVFFISKKKENRNAYFSWRMVLWFVSYQQFYMKKVSGRKFSR